LCTGITGDLSHILPDLKYACIASDARYNTAIDFFLDSIFLHRHLKDVIICAYPITTAFTELLDNTMELDYVTQLSKINKATATAFAQYPNEDCQFEVKEFPLATGLDRLKYLNIGHTGITNFPISFLEYFDKPEVHVLSRLSIQLIFTTTGNVFNYSDSLTTLDLSECQLTTIPRDTFSQLVSLCSS
jgi:Leucine-rich repeat (LRR) protein